MAEQNPDSEVLAKAGVPSKYTTLMQSQSCCAGHVARMSDQRIPKRLLYREMQCGKCSQDTPKTSLKSFGINIDTWEDVAQDRTAWHAHIQQGSSTHKLFRKSQAIQ
jgi:hypothetical protein